MSTGGHGALDIERTASQLQTPPTVSKAINPTTRQRSQILPLHKALILILVAPDLPQAGFYNDVMGKTMGHGHTEA
jgi:hypothetical protein